MTDCNSKEKISIIVPVYNVEKYIAECIESLINQTYHNIEIILVNDGSTDNSRSICATYAKSDNRIVILDKENGGLSSARNKGLDEADGRYVTFVDSDDYIANDMVECLYNLLVRNKADISCVGMSGVVSEVKTGNINDYETVEAKKAIEYILMEKNLTTSASGKLYKIELWKDIRFPYGKIFEDYATIYKVFAKCGKITISQFAKYYYRPNDSGITGGKFSIKKLDYFEVSSELEQFVNKNYPEMLKHVKNRETRYAISFYRNMSQSRYDSREIRKRLSTIIRKNILNYIKTDYAFTSRMYGILISIMPRAAYAVFRGKG